MIPYGNTTAHSIPLTHRNTPQESRSPPPCDMLMGNVLCVAPRQPRMAAQPRTGIAHPTVVPTNYDPDEDEREPEPTAG